jgi:exonuclease III
MRLVTWNCKLGLTKKLPFLMAFEPDIAVVQECAEVSISSLKDFFPSAIWVGENPRKGMGIFTRGHWKGSIIEKCTQRWIVPVQISGPMDFLLIAVWTQRVGNRHESNYIGQLYQALSEHPEWFGKQPVVVCGDWNSNSIWDSQRRNNHSTVVTLLERCGLVSAYHKHFGEAQGKETQSTHYFWHKRERGFHIDHMFVPENWTIQSVTLGDFDTWATRSDHVPVIADLEPTIETE